MKIIHDLLLYVKGKSTAPDILNYYPEILYSVQQSSKRERRQDRQTDLISINLVSLVCKLPDDPCILSVSGFQLIK
jgi:hypothetical protein